ncbi:MAG: proline--tRNA ligase [Synechococcus sp.]|nr:proline--tRNA ligase [Synechococcus sp.]
MRVSALLLVTLRDDPAEAEIPSHRLLLRAGYIRRVASGIYAYLPLMWRVLRKVSAIVREEMDATGALETLLPQLQPAELWQRSGRWAGYTDGEGIMFHLQDRQERSLGLGPTHEEVVTYLAGDMLRSYRQLPVSLYQIQTKFRDEIRPRFGLMRGREFIMKDAYSFHANEADLGKTFAVMEQAYGRIFRRCGLQALAVEADSGAIGGSASKEFMVTAAAGEDLILSSGDGSYAANQERAESVPQPTEPLLIEECSLIDTPAQGSIEALVEGHGFHPSQILKVVLLVARFAEGRAQPLLVSLRGDQQLNEVKLSNVLNAAHAGEWGELLSLQPLEATELAEASLLPLGFIGPDLADAVLTGSPALQPSFLRLADHTALALDRFVCGANQLDRHRLAAAWGEGELVAPPAHDLRCALEGDRCSHDPEQTLQASRGIEVGHIFQLGRKYSEALEARFTNEQGRDEPLWMGCYGIGVSRLAQAAVEQHHDSAGIVWPVPIAPFEVVVVIASTKEAQQVELAERLYGELQQAGVEVLLDDRNERAGVKFKDAELLGIPWRLVVGRGAANGVVELVERSGGHKQEGAPQALVPHLLERLQQQRLGR